MTGLFDYSYSTNEEEKAAINQTLDKNSGEGFQFAERSTSIVDQIQNRSK
jgi:hypothetical protein